MSKLDNIGVEYIGGNRDEFKIFFMISHTDGGVAQESIAVYKGESIVSIICTLLEFVKILIEYK